VKLTTQVIGSSDGNRNGRIDFKIVFEWRKNDFFSQLKIEVESMNLKGRSKYNLIHQQN
jgi:hypothetical protein